MTGFALIGTWTFALPALRAAEALLKGRAPRGMGPRERLAKALVAAVHTAEDDAGQHSVGYGGYPNIQGDVQLDAGYMDGATLRYGAVAGVRDVANPIDVALGLSAQQANCFLCGEGAEHYARSHGYAMKNLLTPDAARYWEEHRRDHSFEEPPARSDDHDTVCVVGRLGEDMATAVSTSGLSLKRAGRVGDSPVVGAGFYCDNRAGGAAATGVGEDAIRTCVSYEAVRNMEAGMGAQRACEEALALANRRMERAGLKPGRLSLIALGADGAVGAATNHRAFPFAVATNKAPATLWLALQDGGAQGMRILAPAGDADLERYKANW